jgi:hypothetical protein
MAIKEENEDSVMSAFSKAPMGEKSAKKLQVSQLNAADSSFLAN